jgi:hypothetical protein
MYHWFVARKVRDTFAQISSGDWEPMITGMATRFSYRFYGQSALSGERHTLDGLRLWWARSFRLLPRSTRSPPASSALPILTGPTAAATLRST